MNYTLGIAAAFLTLLCWTVGTFAFTAASGLFQPLRVNRVRLLYASTALLIISIAFTGLSPLSLISSPGLSQWLWLGLSGIIGLTIGDSLSFTAYSLIGSSRTSLFSIVAPLAAFLVGILLLNEQINTAGIFGMMISLSGVLWFVAVNRSRKNQEIASQDLIRGMGIAALGSIGQGVGLVCAKKGLTMPGEMSITPVHATWMRMLVATSATYLVGVFRTDLIAEFKSVTFNKPLIKYVLLGTLFGPVLGVSFSLTAAKNLEVSLAQTIFSLLPFSVMLFAVISGREKVHWTSFLAAVISIAGVMALVWRDDLQVFLQ